LNFTVGTVKKSTERLRRWLSRKVRQAWDGGRFGLPKYSDTVACEISLSSFWSSP
jgi:hypothetical protein